jgi:DNA mismatch endonuclease (patch repair protein)
MARIKSTNTKPEMRLRQALWASGLRYRVHFNIEKIRPDIVFPGRKLAIFVDGCQWHGCPEHYVCPRTRSDFWQKKLLENIERDTKQTQILKTLDWSVYRVWEHEIWENLPDTVNKINALVLEQGDTLSVNWRVFKVEIIDAKTDLERRYLRLLEVPSVVQIIERIRTTKKWKRLD